MSLFRTQKRLMSAFRISYLPHCDDQTEYGLVKPQRFYPSTPTLNTL